MPKIISTMEPEYRDQDVFDLLRLLDEVILDLDTLAQIQAVTGGFTMTDKANQTFKRQAALTNVLGQLKSNQKG